MALFGALFTAASATLYVLLCLVDREGEPARAVERFWVRGILWLGGVDLRVHEAHHLRPATPYVIMANHRSWFDIPALHRALGRRDTRWVGKKELLPIPFFGWAFAVSRHIAIDRQHRERGVRAIRRAARVSGGSVSIVIFPEGTRSPTRALLPFKKGGFHLALDTGLDILPVAIAGTERILGKGAWTVRPGPADVIFCEPVQAAGRGKGELPGLMQAVRERIEGALNQSSVEDVP